MNFLIVDDEQSICDRTAQRIRELEGIPVTEIVCAYSGEDALKKLEATLFDVLITDIHMGGMDGLELIQKAKAITPSLLSILVSAFDRFEYAKRGIQLGVHDFLVKPYTAKQLQVSLQDLVRQQISDHKQKFSRLDLMLNEAILTVTTPLRQIFLDNRIVIPAEQLCLIVFRQPCRLPQDVGELWFYQPGARAYAIVGYDGDKDLHRWLTQMIEASGESMGVSAPNGDPSELYRQAAAMLDCDWIYDHPSFYCDWQQAGQKSSVSQTVNRLMKLAMVPGSEELLHEISKLEARMEGDLFVQFVGELRLALVRELGELEVATGRPPTAMGCEAKPNTGWQKVITQVLNEIGYAKQYRLDLSRNDPIKWARSYVDSHFGEAVDMAVVANELNLSYPYFSKLFREQAGMVFSQYLLEVRMKEACRLLLNGEKVTDIAEKTGYKNSNNFIRAFKKHYGVPPNVFRTDKQTP